MTLDGVTIKPALALGGWVAFKPAHGGAMAMGDLVLLESEINPVMLKLIEVGVLPPGTLPSCPYCRTVFQLPANLCSSSSSSSSSLPFEHDAAAPGQLSPEQPRDRADPVTDQAAVGGEVDVGLDRRGVDPELAAAGHLQRPGQLDHAVVERLERLRPDGVGPADQRGVVGDLLEVDAAELPQHQAVVDEILGLGVAPGIEPHDDEHAEDDLHRCGGAASGAGK